MRVKFAFSSNKTGKFRKSPLTHEHKEEMPKIVREVIDKSDIILEVLDARFIEKTRNYEMEKIVNAKGKRLIFVLNKADLVKLSELKLNYDLTTMSNYVLFSCKSRLGKRRLKQVLKIEAKKLKLQDRKAIVGVIGYPNTGKSSLINTLIGRKSAGTSSVAGFTKSMKKMTFNKDIVLFDTPGAYQEKEDPVVKSADMKKHAEIGVQTYDKVKDPDMIVSELMRQNPGKLEEFYGIEAEGDSEVLLEELGKRKNLKKKGGLVDIDRTAREVLKDWQKGKISLSYSY